MFSRRNDTTEARAGMGEKKKKKKTTFANYIVCISFQSIWLKKTYSFLESGVIWKKKHLNVAFVSNSSEMLRNTKQQ